MDIIFKKISDLRGELIEIDSINNLPFNIKRIFYIKKLEDLPRGFHAHKKCEQILVPISGSFDLNIEFKDGVKINKNLSNDNIGYYIPLYSWLSMENFSNNCIILVICSYKYDENEYIRNYGDYLNEIKNLKKNNEIIKNFDLTDQTKKIKMEIINKIENTIDSGEFVLGNDLINFEKNFALYNNKKYCIGLSNGTSAIKIAIKSLNINLDNTELIFQANTYIAVPIVSNELNLNFNIIDIDDNLLLDLNKLEIFLEKNKNNNKIYVLVLVHLYGYCVDMDKLMNLKNKYNFYLIEDTAQSHGSEYNNKKLGTFGEIGCFSFYPSKNLGSFGEGGAIITDNEEYYIYSKKYRNYGCLLKYEWEIKGSNERMHNLQAGILDVKLKYLDIWNDKRRYLANIYIKNLKDNNLIKIPLLSNNINNYCNSNYHLFIIITKYRDVLKKYLEENNIQCAIHYPKPFYKSIAFKEYNNIFIEKMEELKDNLLSLPMYPELSENSVLKICECINNFKI